MHAHGERIERVTAGVGEPLYYAWKAEEAFKFNRSWYRFPSTIVEAQSGEADRQYVKKSFLKLFPVLFHPSCVKETRLTQYIVAIRVVNP